MNYCKYAAKTVAPCGGKAHPQELFSDSGSKPFDIFVHFYMFACIYFNIFQKMTESTDNK